MDEHWMRRALVEAQAAMDAGETPVGAVVVRDGALVGVGRDARQRSGDPTAHAEILALREAGMHLGDWRLDGCEMFVTLEPCPMCAGGILLARIGRLVYGADSAKAGAVRTHCRLLDIETFNHRVEVESGLLAAESSELLKRFFGRIRGS